MKNKTPITSSLLLFLLLLLSFSMANSSANNTKDFIPCLTHYSEDSTSISKVIFTQENPSFTSLLQFSIQNLRFVSPSTPKPLAIITPVLESQIQTVLCCSKKHGIQIRIRCGGHDLEGLSYISRVPFVIIDLINLRSIDVDVESGTAWVQGGANLGELYYRIAEKSNTLGFPGGLWSTVGVGGFIGGGGYGTLERKYGLAADNVIDARLMDVNRNILDKKSMGEDLFWAIRGGVASNFGVLLAWKIKLVPVPETVTVFAVKRTLEEKGTELVHRWQSIAPFFDRDLFIRVQLMSVNQDGKSTIEVTFQSLFLGQVDRLLSFIQESFPELGLTREDCTEMSWIKSTLYFAGNAAFPNGESVEVLLNRSAEPKFYYKAKSDYVKVPIPVEGFEGIWERFFELEDEAATILLTPYGGKMYEYSESAIPFPHRAGNLFMVYIGVSWEAHTPESIQEKRLNWLKMIYSYLGSYVSQNPREAYVNYSDLDLGEGTSYEEASIWAKSYFKDNFDRLVQAKSAVDPDNFFQCEQSIPIFPTKSEL